ncbi:molybdopterin-synthase adenylyltransferase MoeB [Carboxylicivirga sp. M1479]|uniref:molybdopterin-synthase adenylyltransferase MoeB n=1 Tax=Carboxylicivirga sp. M1479 TaxID=2594476 RepID=UPI00117775E7|nr:molybdopterin-synthase adenylyltransferase MoeB [Carboxylicivirga sp. M1479]TRX70589.1 molybdopterin-synthase adenylyltransferase MoeB [Carboxylicivirga sp. M1479]
MSLTTEELERYKRHTILPELGIKGQEQLKQASVLIVGTGGLGSPIAMYLAASGVGHIGLVDFDVVDASNLQRQIIHKTSQVGIEKTRSAKNSIQEINPHVKVSLFNEALTSANAHAIIKQFDIVCDGTDNFATRYLVNDACVLNNKINVFGSIRQFEGQVSVFGASDGPCYRCLFPEPPEPGTVPSCAEAGVLGVLPGVIGTLQASEVIKQITGIGKPLIGRLLNYDALEMQFNEIKFAKDPECPCCGKQPSITELIDYEAFCNSNTTIDLGNEISAKELKELLQQSSAPVIIDVRETEELLQGQINGSIHIPMNEIPARMNELPRDKAMVVYCHLGMRSAYVIQFLKDEGYTLLSNLSGGFDAWEAIN